MGERREIATEFYVFPDRESARDVFKRLADETAASPRPELSAYTLSDSDGSEWRIGLVYEGSAAARVVAEFDFSPGVPDPDPDPDMAFAILARRYTTLLTVGENRVYYPDGVPLNEMGGTDGR